MKKTLLLTLLFIVCTFFGKAQLFKKQPVSSTFSDSLAAIVLDFKHDFKAIQGAALPSQGEMDVYRSKVSLPGAIHCVVYRFHSEFDSTASWQAIMYDGESYEEAVKIYKSTFKSIKQSRLKWLDEGYIGFNGTMEKPVEEIRFTISSLRLDIIDRLYKKFVAEVELVNTYSGWEVHVNLQNKKDDKEEY